MSVHYTQQNMVDSRNHPKTDEVKGMNLILVHQHKDDEYSIEILPKTFLKPPNF